MKTNALSQFQYAVALTNGCCQRIIGLCNDEESGNAIINQSGWQLSPLNWKAALICPILAYTESSIDVNIHGKVTEIEIRILQPLMIPA
jgi:hypothetical protein